MISRKVLINKYIKVYKGKRIPCNNKNNIPNPILDHSSVIFYKFSQKNDNICENFFRISLKPKSNNYFSYFLDFKNLIYWNYFIYQVFC